MSSLKIPRAALALSALPLAATGQQPGISSEIVDKVVMQEQAEIQLLRQYSLLVETCIQYLRLDKQLRAVPDGDKYLLGRAKLAKGVDLEPLERDPGLKRKLSEDWREFLSKGFVPGGFVQMIIWILLASIVSTTSLSTSAASFWAKFAASSSTSGP